MSDALKQDIAAVQAIPAVPNILDVVCRSTGMGFAAVARVTEDRWIACQVLDSVDFGLPAGGELKIESTICNEIRQHREIVAIDNVAEDPVYCNHHTPATYGLQSYISVPIILPDGTFFGTLCAIDPKPAMVSSPHTVGMFKLFAELIAYHLDANQRLEKAQSELTDERGLSEVREQFIAVLGHDLRNPIAAVDGGLNRLLRRGWSEDSPAMVRMMKASVARMSGLVNNIMDLARARLGGGIELEADLHADIAATLDQVIEEFRTAQPERLIATRYDVKGGVRIDHARISQMFSNLLGNALTHGAADRPIGIHADIKNGMFTLAVVNGGEPIPTEKIAKLFQPYQRGDGSREGLGLGLYIASEIAKAHGGTLEVLSTEDETRFTFRMPL